MKDELDFRYHASCERLDVGIARGQREAAISIDRMPGSRLDIDFSPQPIRRCRNNCLFCFINQLPQGLRRSLYVKDEDVDHSFANGNYLTLTSAGPGDLQRIADYGISPLYISVHATDPGVRRRLLRNPGAPDVREQLVFLERNHIRFHTQIVVCPGINDGHQLETTVTDLLRFRRGVLSVAIVPVGLTRFHRDRLIPVDGPAARRICGAMQNLRARDEQKNGMHRVYLADELFILAGLPVPSTTYYRDYPQIENGVGLVRTLLVEWSRLRKSLSQRCHPRFDVRAALITGTLAAPFLRTIAIGMEKLMPGASLSVVTVPNHFFGTTATVAGLLTGRDIVAAMARANGHFDAAIVPGVIFNHRGHTLDGYSQSRLGRRLGMRIAAASALREIPDILERRK